MSDDANGNPSDANSYGADSIKVLKGLDAVRRRPGMYIGDTSDGSGLHHMVYEVVDNAIDEMMAGFARRVDVTLNADGSCTVEDDGRGIPVAIHEGEGISAAEVVMTKLHAGGKGLTDDSNAYKVSGGLHGVGVTVVNALSIWLELTIWRDGKEHFIRFRNGEREAPLAVVGDAGGKRGTRVTFLPSPDTFTQTEFSYATLEHRLRELAFLNSGGRIVLHDARHAPPKHEEMHYEGGIAAFVKHLDKAKKPLFAEPISITGGRGERRSEITAEVALWWNDSFHENTLCFTNNIPQRDGGKHLEGFRAALTRIVNKYADETGIAKREKVELTGEDAREGLTCVLSVKVPDPKFSSQTKDKLVSSEVRPVVESIVSDQLGAWFEEHPREGREVIQKVVQAAAAREAARKAREITRKSVLNINSLPGKLAECQDRNPANTEMFIVEGDSAGGSAKQARNREFQAVLPIRGKILNVERVRMDKILSSQEIGTLITALGTGIGRDEQGNSAIDLAKLRYHKIIIMTDADVDGAHIRTLLLTFFYRQMPELVEKGHLYIAQPPLYKVTRGRAETYLKDQRALEDYLIDVGLGDAVLELASGEVRAGKDLRDVVEQARAVGRIFDDLHSRYSRPTVEQAAIGGAFEPSILLSSETANARAAEIAKRLDMISEGLERGWSGRIGNEGFVFRREVRGVVEAHVLDRPLLGSVEARRLNERRGYLAEVFGGPAMLKRKDTEQTVFGPRGLLQAVYDVGRKGINLQRYKGLGEMNPEQLWETTLDRETRTLLQVKVADLTEAEEIFTKLMGEVVEPRREFIQENALSASVDV